MATEGAIKLELVARGLWNQKHDMPTDQGYAVGFQGPYEVVESDEYVETLFWWVIDGNGQDYDTLRRGAADFLAECLNFLCGFVDAEEEMLLEVERICPIINGGGFDSWPTPNDWLVAHDWLLDQGQDSLARRLRRAIRGRWHR
jgi:hypothetical protein